MVAGLRADEQLLERVAGIYLWLAEQIRSHAETPECCKACGDCCDFDAFDHRLFITPPELMYLAANIGVENIKSMPAGRCPYNIEGKCSVYEYRFAGCRIFCCDSDRDFQSELSEAVLEKLKSVCTEFQIPYRYTSLAMALNACAGG